MSRILHILTTADDPLAKSVIAHHSKKTSIETDVVDLTVAEPDYELLLEKIFEADSVQVW